MKHGTRKGRLWLYLVPFDFLAAERRKGTKGHTYDNLPHPATHTPQGHAGFRNRNRPGQNILNILELLPAQTGSHHSCSQIQLTAATSCPAIPVAFRAKRTRTHVWHSYWHRRTVLSVMEGTGRAGSSCSLRWHRGLGRSPSTVEKNRRTIVNYGKTSQATLALQASPYFRLPQQSDKSCLGQVTPLSSTLRCPST